VRILFFVQHLASGGVMRQMATQAEHLNRRGHSVSLLGLYEVDEDWRFLWTPSSGDVCALLGRPALVPLLGATCRLRRTLRKERVDVLYAYQGNLARFIAWVATRRSRTTLVWGLRGAGRSYSLREGLKLALPFYLCRAVSASVPLLIANSDAARARRSASGFRCRRELTIPNGFDTDAFRPDPRLVRGFAPNGASATNGSSASWAGSTPSTKGIERSSRRLRCSDAGGPKSAS
jgi:hypothetical protein